MSRTSPQHRREAERLHDVLAVAADTLKPSPVPLAAIVRVGRARRRRRTVGLVIGCGLLLAPPAVAGFGVALPDHAPPAPGQAATRPTPPDTFDPVVFRVVAPGERVRTGTGPELWLTEKGLHRSTPGTPDQYQAVGDRAREHPRPTVGMTADTVGDRYFLSGLYTGDLRAGRVIVESAGGPLTATVVRLPGTPGWGAWYAELPLRGSLAVHRVTLYDERGREVTSLRPASP
ncbi:MULTISPECIES: hypothetical protein [Streptomyces]|jgi:hypothetical protein|uniref:Uncharacterized protein n=1 Tax=Streptomyces parvulus TaxID=146923 RepID=A0A191VAZ6_9ACTN|nr:MULTISPECIES: hypothetical protein [Streptomyces]ANJ12085.1 hypothetical protein Spa2297_33980 [Streptomyces parvulus]MZD57573.1 hypothetical protein [Streptomyces sp. SID5606]GGS05649.1 hypothetical protein GCM10010220_67390 [Streptomyces parvulus]